MKLATEPCPFCSPAEQDIVLQNLLCYARYDRHPLSKGHLLIVPFLHEPSFLSLDTENRTAMFELVPLVLLKLEIDLEPDGYNVGINMGQAAGQTVMHTHIHVIPRYIGDVPDPRGGVRCVIPEKAVYW